MKKLKDLAITMHHDTKELDYRKFTIRIFSKVNGSRYEFTTKQIHDCLKMVEQENAAVIKNDEDLNCSNLSITKLPGDTHYTIYLSANNEITHETLANKLEYKLFKSYLEGFLRSAKTSSIKTIEY